MGVTLSFFVVNPDYPKQIEEFVHALSQRYDAIPILQRTEPAVGLGRPDSRDSFTLRNRGESQTIIVEPSRLVIKTGVPYEGWKVFQQRIEECVSAWLQIYQHTTLQSVSLQYENLIVVMNGEAPEAFIPAVTALPPATPMQLSTGYIASNYINPSDNSTLSISLIRYPSRVEGQLAIGLDLASSSGPLDPTTPISSYTNTLTILRQQIQIQFEAMITDRAREQFGIRRA